MESLDKEIICRRLMRLDGLLKRLEEHSRVSRERYISDEDLQALVERRLHLSAQICLDIAHHFLARLNLELPDEEENVFIILSKAGILPQELSDRLKGLVRFRNILVHNYLDIDPGIVHDNLRNNLQDFRDFAREVNRFIESRQK